MSKNYIDNPSLTASLGAWSDACRKAAKQKQPAPPMPEDVGQAALQIATGYSKRSNFAGYTYVEDMVSEALLSVVKYAHSFNLKKSNNGFAYLTTIIHNSMVRFIQAEQKQSYVKMASTVRANQEVSDTVLESMSLFENRMSKRAEQNKSNFRKKKMAA